MGYVSGSTSNGSGLFYYDVEWKITSKVFNSNWASSCYSTMDSKSLGKFISPLYNSPRGLTSSYISTITKKSSFINEANLAKYIKIQFLK